MLRAVDPDYLADTEPPLSARHGSPPLVVLKFGGSVLRTPADLPRVAGEIYRQRRRGFTVVAVVSAFHGETDRLLAEAAAAGGEAACDGVADLVSLGEARTAALLRIACGRIGLSALGCQAEELGVTTVGPETASRAVAFDPTALTAKLARAGLVIVPGFVGIGKDGGRALLERGGSDFSAIYLAGELGADVARLYKDADGVFEADPHRDPNARRYDEISWDDALRVARPLIQPLAVDYARTKRLPIEVEAIGSARVTRVGARTGALRAPVPDAPIRVGLMGYGMIGQAVARRLSLEPRFKLVAALVRDPVEVRAHRPPVELTIDRTRFLAARPDIVVDLLFSDAASQDLEVELLGAGVRVLSALACTTLVENAVPYGSIGGVATTQACVDRGASSASSAEAIVAALYDVADAIDSC